MIKTENLKLIPCELMHFESILKNQKELEPMLGVTVPDNWLEFPEAMQCGYEYLKANPSALDWWTYLFVHAKDGVLVGLGGFKGEANEVGMVEIGYGIIPEYRCRGLATEAAHGLIEFAFSHPHVELVEAHTLAEGNASTRVLEKVGMKYVETVDDPEDGEIWHWRLSRENYEA